MLVIARYNENLSWIKNASIPFVVYNKGKKIDIDNCIDVPNIGREGETWLRYIKENYHQLPPVVKFLQGNPVDHCNVNDVLNFIYGNKIPETVLPIGKIFTDDANGYPHHPKLKVGATYKNIFNKEKNEFRFAAGAQYAVNKNCIHSKTLSWWKELYDIYNETEQSPWIFERLWMDIFSAN